MSINYKKLAATSLIISGFVANRVEAEFPQTSDNCELLASALAEDDCWVADNGIHYCLLGALKAVPRDSATNGGLGLEVWATLVDRDGYVCAVAFSGADRGSQRPIGRITSAQKAFIANAFSLPNIALSTANLYASSQPGGALWNIHNPGEPAAAVSGDPAFYGTINDEMVGKYIAGHNFYGGGLALYKNGRIVGGLGVSGDTPCKDHNYAWRVRHHLGLDHVPRGMNSDPLRPDNIIYDMGEASEGKIKSKSTFGHVDCGLNEKKISLTLPPIEK